MLLEALRQKCDAEHRALHIHPFLAPLSGEITLERYKDIIRMFYAVYSSTESQKPKHELPDSPVITWLESDMRFHGIDGVKKTATRHLDNYEGLVGYLYVKQGSSLGGQYISRHLQDKLGLQPGKSNHFFYGYGNKTGSMWRQFREKIAVEESKLNHAKVIDSAKQTFKAISLCADRMLEQQA